MELSIHFLCMVVVVNAYIYVYFDRHAAEDSDTLEVAEGGRACVCLRLI